MTTNKTLNMGTSRWRDEPAQPRHDRFRHLRLRRGVFGYVDLTKLGAYITKGLCMHHAWQSRHRASSERRVACSMPSACRTSASTPSSKKLPFIRSVDTPCIVNWLAGRGGIRRNGRSARRSTEVAALEMNILLPQCAAGRHHLRHRPRLRFEHRQGLPRAERRNR